MDVSPATCGRARVKSLLLMYLFVLKAAADCSTPQGGQNIVLTTETILLNEFPEGSSATLECGKGYVKDSGSNIITCINGTWTQPELICKKRDCGPPEIQANMHINVSQGTLFGAVAAVSCEKGYQVIGSSFKQCFATGWHGKANCRLVTCSLPVSVANGKVLWVSNDRPKYEDVISYVCDDGYTLIGKESITCTETGRYDSQPPECQEVPSSTHSPARPTTHRDKPQTASPTTTPPSSTKGMTTQDGQTTQTVTPTSTTQEQEASSSTYSPARPTTHRDKTQTDSPTTTLLPSSTKGARGILTLGDKATTASVTSTTSVQDKDVDTQEDNGHAPLIASVSVSIILVACVLGGFAYKYLLRRKGSYDTKEDLKPELLQFQNL